MSDVYEICDEITLEEMELLAKTYNGKVVACKYWKGARNV